jgi:NADH-quinone oxidoreductase subunit L
VVAGQGGGLYTALLLLGLLTALLTSFYTFRMLFVVFHGEASSDDFHQGGPSQPLPLVMTVTLIPLALLGLCSGLLNLPEFLAGHGVLSRFLGTVGGFAPHGGGDYSMEIALQILAATASVIGLGLAWSRYTGERRAWVLAREEAGMPGAGFLLRGWRLDDLYHAFFINPVIHLARFLWKGIDEAGINGALDALGRGTGRLGQASASWCTGRVAVSLMALAGGVAAALVYVAWRAIG